MTGIFGQPEENLSTSDSLWGIPMDCSSSSEKYTAGSSLLKVDGLIGIMETGDLGTTF